MCQKTFGFGTQPQLPHKKQLSITTLHYQSSDVGTVEHHLQCWWSTHTSSLTSKCVPTPSTAENSSFTIKALKKCEMPTFSWPIIFYRPASTSRDCYVSFCKNKQLGCHISGNAILWYTFSFIKRYFHKILSLNMTLVLTKIISEKKIVGILHFLLLLW